MSPPRLRPQHTTHGCTGQWPPRGSPHLGLAGRMFAIGAAWGFRPASELIAHGAGTPIHHPPELL